MNLLVKGQRRGASRIVDSIIQSTYVCFRCDYVRKMANLYVEFWEQQTNLSVATHGYCASLVSILIQFLAVQAML